MSSKRLLRIGNAGMAIIFVALLLICCIWAGLYYAVQNERRMEIDYAYQETTAFARMAEEHTVRTIRGMDQIVLFLKYQVEKDGWNIDIPQLVGEKRFEGQPFVQLGIVDEYGNVIANNIVPFVPANVKDREHFLVHRADDSGGLYISKPLIARVSGKLSIQLSRRINNKDGSFAGVAVASIDPNFFAEFYKMVNFGKNSSISLVGRDGFVRVWQADQSIDIGADFRQSELMNLLLSAKEGSAVIQSRIDGIKRIISYRSLDGYPLIVAVGISEEQVLQSLNRHLGGYYWVCGTLSLALVLFAAMLLAILARRRQLEVQNVLHELAEAVVLSPSPGELYLKVHQLVARVLPAKNFFIALHDVKKGEIIVEYSADEANVIPRRRPIEKGLTEYAIRQGKVVYLTAIDFEQLWQTGEVGLRFVNINEWLGAPLRASTGEVFGVIALFSIAGSSPGKLDDPEVMSIIAAQVSLAIERNRSEYALKASQSRYQALVEQSFEALALIDIRTREVLEINRRFTDLFGYSLPEDAPLYVDQFVADSQENLNKVYDRILTQQRFVPMETRVFHHKNGMAVYVERTGSVVNIDGRDMYLASMRDVTSERRRQAELNRDFEFARRTQKGLLPVVTDSEHVGIRTLYYPVNFVSGDAYNLEWRNDGCLLRGFLIDVSGHGLATAIQTSSINVLLREAANSQLSLLGQIELLNARATQYFTEDAYAAIIGFELDLSRRELRYIGAGITQFYANGEKIKAPGMFVGIWSDAEFEMGTINFELGDCFYFLTDGFTDALLQPQSDFSWSPERKEFATDTAALEQLAESGTLHDDASAICLQIKKFL
jgi:PAS domain S-box-containing protein